MPLTSLARPTRGAPSGWAHAGPTWGPSGWAHAGPKWVGPRRAQAGPKWVGPSWAQVGPSQNVGTQKIQKTKILKIKIRSAQNVGNIFLCRKKASPPHLGPSRAIFCVGPEKKNVQTLPIFLGGPMGPIHPVWGPGYTDLAPLGLRSKNKVFKLSG